MKRELIIVAGPSGSGKSTFAGAFLEKYPYRYVNADDIARELNPADLAAAKIRAGKEFFNRIQKALYSGESIVIESTLSGLYLSY